MMEQVEIDAVRRGTPKYDGIYIEGMLQGVEVNLTVDTGATLTIVSSKVYEGIPEERRPTLIPLPSHKHLTNAEGSSKVMLYSRSLLGKYN